MKNRLFAAEHVKQENILKVTEQPVLTASAEFDVLYGILWLHVLKEEQC